MLSKNPVLAIFPCHQLFLERFLIIQNTASIGSAPVLGNIPVAAGTAVAGGDQPFFGGSIVHAPDQVTDLCGKYGRKQGFILDSPQHQAWAVPSFPYKFCCQLFEIFMEFFIVKIQMRTHLCPVQNAVAVAVINVMEIVGTVGLPECVKACRLNLLHACLNLFRFKCMVASKTVLVFCRSI